MSPIEFFLKELELYDDAIFKGYEVLRQNDVCIVYKIHQSTIRLNIGKDGFISSVITNHSLDRVLVNKRLCPSALLRYLKQTSVINFLEESKN